MTAMTGSVGRSPADLAVTRAGLHRVAEHVLAAARYAASGKIGLVNAAWAIAHARQRAAAAPPSPTHRG
jgi:hypothetical protein